MRGGTARGRARAAETGLGAEAGAGSVASCMMKEEQSLVIFKKCTPVFPNLVGGGTPTVLSLDCLRTGSQFTDPSVSGLGASTNELISCFRCI